MNPKKFTQYGPKVADNTAKPNKSYEEYKEIVVEREVPEVNENEVAVVDTKTILLVHETLNRIKFLNEELSNLKKYQDTGRQEVWTVIRQVQYDIHDAEMIIHRLGIEFGCCDWGDEYCFSNNALEMLMKLFVKTEVKQ